LRVVSRESIKHPTQSLDSAVLKAGSSKAIKNLSQPEFKEGITKFLKKTVVFTGLKIEPEYMVEIIAMTSQTLYTHFKNLTFDEMYLALELNATGQLPRKVESYGSNLTIKYIADILALYNETRISLLKRLGESKKLELPDKKLTEEEKYNEDVKYVQLMFRNFCAKTLSHTQTEMLHMVFDTLYKYGIVKVSEDEREEYLMQAKIHRHKLVSGPAFSKDEKREFKNLLDQYEKETFSTDEVIEQKRLAKRLFVIDYFKNLLNEGREISLEKV
jgi:hypothetical protein